MKHLRPVQMSYARPGNHVGSDKEYKRDNKGTRGAPRTTKKAPGQDSKIQIAGMESSANCSVWTSIPGSSARKKDCGVSGVVERAGL